MVVLGGYKLGSPLFVDHQNIDLQNDFDINGILHITATVLYLTTTQAIDVDFTQIWTEGLNESCGGTGISYLVNTSAYDITFKLMGTTQFIVTAGTARLVFAKFDEGNPIPSFKSYQL